MEETPRRRTVEPRNGSYRTAQFSDEPCEVNPFCTYRWQTLIIVIAPRLPLACDRVLRTRNASGRCGWRARSGGTMATLRRNDRRALDRQPRRQRFIAG